MAIASPSHGGWPEWPDLLPVSYGPAFFDSDLSIFKNFAIKESMKLQIRAMAYNFLNHPLYSFPSGNPLTLQFVQDPVSQVITQTNTNFGHQRRSRERVLSSLERSSTSNSTGA